MQNKYPELFYSKNTKKLQYLKSDGCFNHGLLILPELFDPPPHPLQYPLFFTISVATCESIVMRLLCSAVHMEKKH